MRRPGWLLFGLPLALAWAVGAVAAEAPKPTVLGVGPAYETLGKVSVMHAGRFKPLDTLAREEVKQIFGRETVKLHELAVKVDGRSRLLASLTPEEAKRVFGGAAVELEPRVTSTWGPVAALFDWSVRPEFWDGQPIILVEYLPLKRLLLDESLQARLAAIAAKPETSAGARAAIKTLADDTELTASRLTRFAATAGLTPDDRKAVEELAAALVETSRWATPLELENAKVKVDGKRLAFDLWFRDIDKRKREAEANPSAGGTKLTDLEKRTLEVGTRLVHYQAVRDREPRSVEPMLIMPRPNNAAHLAFIAKTLQKGREQGPEALSPLELDSANALLKFFNDIPLKDRQVPGTDPEFDKRFAAWLESKSAWVPLAVVLKAKPEELAEAGYPADRTEAFRAAFKAMETAEEASPGKAPVARASTLLAASRSLGEKVNPEMYPTMKDVELETFFNEYNPFWKAPIAYGIALVILTLTLGFVGAARRSTAWWAGTAAYGLGMLALLAGIALEVAGFTMRVKITGWAPVTNMYETVIWVSLVAAVLSVVIELIFRKTYAAQAGAGVALLGTVLAANVPLLDPTIHNLQPVLRSNYWLTIHVLTEVSSYAAFALAMGLGVIATLYYLTATYRRSPGVAEVASPLLPGVPLLAVGGVGVAAGYGLLGPSWNIGATAFYLLAGMAYLGEVLTIVGLGAVVGEVVARALFREDPSLALAAQSGEAALPAATAVQTVTVGEASGAVATLARPTIAEIRARAASSRPKLDSRGLAMQETAAKIKPLSNFIYRTMQVGVLLVAAGTFLGGWWADVSWGRFWGWDPKEVWALITLLVYLVPLHGRFAGWVNMFGLVVASVVCFLSVIMAWYGVNFVLGVGLHSYGFTEGGGQGIVSAVVLAVLALTFAAGWRRYLGSHARGASA